MILNHSSPTHKHLQTKRTQKRNVNNPTSYLVCCFEIQIFHVLEPKKLKFFKIWILTFGWTVVYQVKGTFFKYECTYSGFLKRQNIWARSSKKVNFLKTWDVRKQWSEASFICSENLFMQSKRDRKVATIPKPKILKYFGKPLINWNISLQGSRLKACLTRIWIGNTNNIVRKWEMFWSKA